MAYAALAAGDNAKAAAYAKETLAAAKEHADDWNAGNGVHHGHIALGLLALLQGDLPVARQHLLDAGRTKGSPQLDSFGPNMSLARELLAKGETAVVLEYLALCHDFWKMGAPRLDAWAASDPGREETNLGINLR
jgi:hypothetical protein